MYTNFILLPLIYLGGVFYPISILPPAWAGLSHLNPLFYLIDGFRHALLGQGDLSFTTAFAVSGADGSGPLHLGRHPDRPQLPVAQLRTARESEPWQFSDEQRQQPPR